MVAAEILVAEEAHVLDVAARMRPADRQEVLASAGFTPEQALRESMAVSVFARVLVLGGEVAGMFGVAADVVQAPGGLVRVRDGPNGIGPAVPWAMTTVVVDRHPIEFWLASKRILAALRGPFPVLVQRVDARYGAALRWLARLGFTIGPPEPWGRYGLPFHLVTLSPDILSPEGG